MPPAAQDTAVPLQDTVVPSAAPNATCSTKPPETSRWMWTDGVRASTGISSVLGPWGPPRAAVPAPPPPSLAVPAAHGESSRVEIQDSSVNPASLKMEPLTRQDEGSEDGSGAVQCNASTEAGEEAGPLQEAELRREHKAEAEFFPPNGSCHVKPPHASAAGAGHECEEAGVRGADTVVPVSLKRQREAESPGREEPSPRELVPTCQNVEGADQDDLLLGEPRPAVAACDETDHMDAAGQDTDCPLAGAEDTDHEVALDPEPVELKEDAPESTCPVCFVAFHETMFVSSDAVAVVALV